MRAGASSGRSRQPCARIPTVMRRWTAAHGLTRTGQSAPCGSATDCAAGSFPTSIHRCGSRAPKACRSFAPCIWNSRNSRRRIVSRSSICSATISWWRRSRHPEPDRRAWPVRLSGSRPEAPGTISSRGNGSTAGSRCSSRQGLRSFRCTCGAVYRSSCVRSRGVREARRWRKPSSGVTPAQRVRPGHLSCMKTTGSAWATRKANARERGSPTRGRDRTSP